MLSGNKSFLAKDYMKGVRIRSGASVFIGIIQTTIDRCFVLEDNHEKGGSQYMSVKKEGEKYRCNKCGNEVVVTKAGGGILVCCGQDMEKIEG